MRFEQVEINMPSVPFQIVLALYVFGIDLHPKKCSTASISAHYQIYPEVGQLGLSCVSQDVEYNRAVRVDNTSQICELLDSDWNLNPIFEDGYIYMQMLSYEKRFPEAIRVTSDIPEEFAVGSGFDAVLHADDIPSLRFHVIVTDYDTKKTFLHIQFRPNSNKTSLRSEFNGEWTNDTLAPLPTFHANTPYTVSVYLQVLQWEVLVDGRPLKNYTHVYPFQNTGNQKARFWGTDVMCRNIIFHLVHN